jgi:hypothetical protein
VAPVPRPVSGRTRRPAPDRDGNLDGLWAYERHTALPYEALAIFAVVLLNATMGHVQQSRAQAALAALRVMSADQAAVIPVGRMNQASTPVIRVTAPRASAPPYADSGAESSIRKRTLGGAQASLTSGSPWRSFHIT